MRCVYILQSIPFLKQHYTGSTSDLTARVAKHNAGGSPHTTRFKPWKVLVSIEFEDDAKANALEAYLKTGSGRAFANKHFL